jgi:DnaJ-class molecular chaperone
VRILKIGIVLIVIKNIKYKLTAIVKMVAENVNMRRTKMINGQLAMLKDSGATLQYECEECVGHGNIPISCEEVVTCPSCGGRGWTENLSSIPQDIIITVRRK